MKYDFSSLHDQNVVITGGSGSIGLSFAEGFLSQGSNVYLWGHRSIDSSHKFKEYRVLDLTDCDLIEKAVSELPDVVHTLVNCAGITIGNSTYDYDLSDWNKTIALNLTAPFYLSKLIAPKMTSTSGGSIINITSIGAELGFPGNPAYGASKGGLKQLTKAMACDFAQYGIRVNNVGPGYTTTKMTIQSWNDEYLRNQRTERTMLKRWAAPDDITGMVLFLASDMSRYITGQDIYIDGGWTSKGL